MSHLGEKLQSQKLPTTIDELLEYPTSAEKMSDKELESFLRPFFPATRPGKLLAAEVDKHERLSGSMSDEELLAKARAMKAAKLEKAKQNESKT